jgi:2-phospho-L-lactate guanylyltransferase
MNSIWAIVPLKPFGIAKQRLAPVLDVHCRAQLAQAMAERVLAVLGAMQELAGVAVVTADKEVARQARSQGAYVVEEPAGASLNEALTFAADILQRKGATALLIVPGDLPLLKGSALSDLLRTALDRSVIIVPAHSDGGTNVLFVSPPTALPFSFGNESASEHLTKARAARLHATMQQNDFMGFDLDTPADLAKTAEMTITGRLGDIIADMRERARAKA